MTCTVLLGNERCSSPVAKTLTVTRHVSTLLQRFRASACWCDVERNHLDLKQSSVEKYIRYSKTIAFDQASVWAMKEQVIDVSKNIVYSIRAHELVWIGTTTTWKRRPFGDLVQTQHNTHMAVKRCALCQ